jgi:hypothetical protein
MSQDRHHDTACGHERYAGPGAYLGGRFFGLTGCVKDCWCDEDGVFHDGEKEIRAAIALPAHGVS